MHGRLNPDSDHPPAVKKDVSAGYWFQPRVNCWGNTIIKPMCAHVPKSQYKCSSCIQHYASLSCCQSLINRQSWCSDENLRHSLTEFRNNEHNVLDPTLLWNSATLPGVDLPTSPTCNCAAHTVHAQQRRLLLQNMILCTNSHFNSEESESQCISETLLLFLSGLINYLTPGNILSLRKDIRPHCSSGSLHAIITTGHMI